ncbi:GNAT family N-acetyltransferase [Kribbia dieselivorans]|uniref:GNAT family N-acetyltransferase n=1 Tax=Kribbia dieselivorans TaxID=331526 RepID=UPI0008390480|nr:GNAT family N-acetyltransferase [Kribbia dieselivorans]
MQTQDSGTTDAALPNDTPLAVEIVRNDERSRYEARRGDEVLGFSEYSRRPGVIDFCGTFVEPEYEGHGIASQLARYSLDEVRERGTEQVIPSCWYYAGWIERHPDYADLLGPAASGSSAADA